MTGALFASMPDHDLNYTIGTSFTLLDKHGYPVLINNVTAFHMESESENWSQMGQMALVSMVDILDDRQNHEVTWNVSVVTMYDAHDFIFLATENPLDVAGFNYNHSYFGDDDTYYPWQNSSYPYYAAHAHKATTRRLSNSIPMKMKMNAKLVNVQSFFDDDGEYDDDYTETYTDQFLLGVGGKFSGPSTDW